MTKQEYRMLAENPVFFERNRVFRVYQGGALFNGVFGDEPVDNNYPEEWIASNVRAMNGGDDPHEGISRIQGTDVFFDELLNAEHALLLGSRKDLGILVKVLDSAIRLPVQVHPDKAFSKKYFSSEYGKVESWLVLATRENAKIYFGFRDKITEAQFLDAIERSEAEKDALGEILHEIPVKRGDVFLVPAKTVHTIGPGCLILEVQEPTDFTITPDPWCGDYHLREDEKYIGLAQETAMNCFDFEMYGKHAEEVGRKMPCVFAKTNSTVSETLIGGGDTPCFSVNRHRIKGGELVLQNAPAIYIVTEGQGTIEKDSYRRNLKKGDYFFLPYALSGLCYIGSSDGIEVIECLPPVKE